MLMELNNVRKIVCREASYFQNPLVDEEKKKKRLNFLFVKDLLDGVNGMIMDHKDRRDNEMVTHQVESWHKVFASFVLFFTSFGMLYYVYLFSMNQSASRQRAWFNSFQVWFFFEVCVISTGLVFVEHVAIPLWSLREVQRVKERIVSDILTFQKKVKKMNNKTKMKKDLHEEIGEANVSSFNAAEFLYPSHRIAQLFPQYPESELILRYQTPWPKKSFKQGEKSMRKRYDKRFEFVTKTVTRVVVFALSSILQLPPSLQDMGIQVTLLALCGAIVRFHLRLYNLSPVLVTLPSLLMATVVYVLFVSGRKVRNLVSRTYPLNVDKGDEDEGNDNDNDERDIATAAGDDGKLNEEKGNSEKENRNHNLKRQQRQQEDGRVREEKDCESSSALMIPVSRGSHALESLSLAEQLLSDSQSDSEFGSEADDSDEMSDLFDPVEWAELGKASRSESSSLGVEGKMSLWSGGSRGSQDSSLSLGGGDSRSDDGSEIIVGVR